MDETRQKAEDTRVHVPCEICWRCGVPCAPASSDSQDRCTRCVRLNIQCTYPSRRSYETWLFLNFATDREGGTSVDDEIEDWRGRAREREGSHSLDLHSSPAPYYDSDETRSQSPPLSFYHDELLEYTWESDNNSVDMDAWTPYEASLPVLGPPGLPVYQYAPILSTDIRLLRISPGCLTDILVIAIRTLPLSRVKESVLAFQALSYAWGPQDEEPAYTVLLYDIETPNESEPREIAMESTLELKPFKIRTNLYQALMQIRQTNLHSWIWVDALCIDQTNEREKREQIPNMPDIYSNAWNVIAWLGEIEQESDDVKRAVHLIPKILNLKTLNSILVDNKPSRDMLLSWVAFGKLLHRPWFRRRWVIQEVACARRLSVRIGSEILSWLDFADAVELYYDKNNRIQELYSRSDLYQIEPNALQGIDSSGARALIELSRNVFRKNLDSGILSRLMNLESLVLMASRFEVSDPRDAIYALLYLANDRRDANHSPSPYTGYRISNSDYSEHPVDIFANFVRHCLTSSQSLDIICRPWAIWPRSLRTLPYKERTLPTWIKPAVYYTEKYDPLYTPSENLLGNTYGSIYNASRNVTSRATVNVGQQLFLRAKGVMLGLTDRVSNPITGSCITMDCLKILGWNGDLQQSLDDRLWRTLVGNRSSQNQRTAPSWYRRACALALTKLNENGHLDIQHLVADKSQPSMLIDYLQRVQTTTKNRSIFRCRRNLRVPSKWVNGEEHAEPIFGFGSQNIKANDLVCILLGSSVPVILRPRGGMIGSPVTLIGACYIHGYMEGELFASMSAEKIEHVSYDFKII